MYHVSVGKFIVTLRNIGIVKDYEFFVETHTIMTGVHPGHSEVVPTDRCFVTVYQ
jgi:hypothetical protein